MGELHFDEDADAALFELERHPSALLDEVNSWLDRLEADHGDRDLRSMAYLGGRFRIDVDNPKGDPWIWMILWKPHPGIQGDTIVHYLGAPVPPVVTIARTDPAASVSRAAASPARRPAAPPRRGGSATRGCRCRV